jgi:hypothetical protein
MLFSVFPASEMRLVWSTKAEPAEIIAQVRSVVLDRVRRFWQLVPPRRGSNGKYYGTVGRDSFEIRPYLFLREGGYLLTVRGDVERCVGGTTITLRLRARAWLFMLLPLLLIELWVVNTGADSPWIIPGFWLIYHAAGCLLVSWQVRRIRRNFDEIVGGR